jgi:hypothetical protein
MKRRIYWLIMAARTTSITITNLQELLLWEIRELIYGKVNRSM